MNYERAAQDLAPTTAFWAAGLLAPDLPVDHMGALALETSSRLRTLALFALLGRADVASFRDNLSRSAGAWCRFLRAAEAAGREGIVHHVSGRLDPLFDALAAGDFARAASIVALAPHERQGRAEYEDDYCTAQLCGLLVAHAPPPERCRTLLERYAQFVAEDECPRLVLLRAIAAGDTAAVHAAVPGVVRGFEAAVAREKDRGSEQTAEQIARQSVCIEALALLALARRRGLVDVLDLRHCPTIAQDTTNRSFPADFD